MMTADKSLFLWTENDDWWDYDDRGNVVLTSKAPKSAEESFRKYKEYIEKSK